MPAFPSTPSYVHLIPISFPSINRHRLALLQIRLSILKVNIAGFIIFCNKKSSSSGFRGFWYSTFYIFEWSQLVTYVSLYLFPGGRLNICTGGKCQCRNYWFAIDPLFLSDLPPRQCFLLIWAFPPKQGGHNGICRSANVNAETIDLPLIRHLYQISLPPPDNTKIILSLGQLYNGFDRLFSFFCISPKQGGHITSSTEYKKKQISQITPPNYHQRCHHPTEMRANITIISKYLLTWQW